jgi:hypothetical protein
MIETHVLLRKDINPSYYLETLLRMRRGPSQKEDLMRQ